MQQQQKTIGVNLAYCGLPIVNLYDTPLAVGVYLGYWGDPQGQAPAHAQLFVVQPVPDYPGKVDVINSQCSISWELGPHEMLVDPVRVLLDDHKCPVNNVGDTNADDECLDKHMHTPGQWTV